MASVHAVGEGLAERAEVHAERVAVEEEDVVRVDGADRLLDALVEGDEAGVLLVGGLVQGVVAGNPGVVLVVLGEGLPDLDGAVLEVLVDPDWGQRRRGA